MPRLIPDGPNIPGELLKKHEAGEVVFVCGAGISVPTGLPNFKALVEELYTALRMVPDSNEQELIDSGKFDEALGRLEKRTSKGVMRSKVVRILSSTPRPHSLRLHRALLAVSRTPSGLHLVTTNFDDNFFRACDPADLRIDVGPSVPDFGSWDSVVHLHGRIPASAAQGTATRLVLTDRDFGQAYLRGCRWAAKFLSRLIDTYSVVFVGYSMSDVIIKYLVKGDQDASLRCETYAFAGSADDEQRDQLSREWDGTGIRLIHYDSSDNHRLLLQVIEEWADLGKDPQQYRVRLAVRGLQFPPDNATHDADPDRVVWALSDPASVRRALRSTSRLPISGSVAASWLDEFAERGLLSGTNQVDSRDRGLAGPMITDRLEQQMVELDFTGSEIASWIGLQAHLPEVFRWVIEHGYNVHPRLRRRLWDRLLSSTDTLPAMPPRLRHLWTLYLAQPPDLGAFLPWPIATIDHASRASTESLDDILLPLLKPRLGVFPGPPPFRVLSADASAQEQVALESCGHTAVTLGCRPEGAEIAALTELDPIGFAPFLRRHAVTLTEYVKTALTLLRSSDRADRSLQHAKMLDESTVIEHMATWTDDSLTWSKWTSSQRRAILSESVGPWTVLLEWVRASYLALPGASPKRDELLRQWVASNERLLWLLALQAIEQDGEADFGLVRIILLGNAQELLWDPDCSGQVLSVLAVVGTRGSSDLQADVLEALEGEGSLGHVHMESDGDVLAVVGPRLAALYQGGVRLSGSSLRTLAAFERRLNADLDDAPHGAVASLRGRIRPVAEKLRAGLVDLVAFQDFAERRPAGAILALHELGRSGDWPSAMWKRVLDVAQARIAAPPYIRRHFYGLATILLELPEDQIRDLNYEIARVVESAAQRWPGPDDRLFWQLWCRGWQHRPRESGRANVGDVLTEALNTTTGKYAGAALERVHKVTTRPLRPIPKEQVSILDEIASDDGCLHGTVMLVFGMNWLYLRAPSWTCRNIVPRLRWRSTANSRERFAEVLALWSVVAFRGSIHPNLVPVLGADLWEAIQRHRAIPYGQKLVGLFVDLSVNQTTEEVENAVGRQTAHKVIADSPLVVGGALRRLLHRGDRSREDTWRELVLPWLDRFWPREQELNTDQSSCALVEVVMASGGAFPEAVDWATHYLTASESRQILIVCHHTDMWKAHPHSTVVLLHRIVPEVGLEPSVRASLAKTLAALRETDASIVRDFRFVELETRTAA